MTFGCQMNAHDSERLSGILAAMGYTSESVLEKAGLVIYNTCCIRENAENRVLGNLGFLKHVKRGNPRILVAVGGCMPQQAGSLARLRDTGVVDILFGTHNLHKFGSLLTEALQTNEPVTDIWDASDGDDTPAPAIRESRVRASVNIMYGCDNFCSYCVVPFVRGRERSRAASAVLDEVRGLLADGVLEITLLGQNVNSYRDENTDFAGLLREISRLDPRRIRFMTSHPKDLSQDLIKTIADCENICRHIHLPVQSGSDSVLSAMNRGYTRDRYLSLLAAIRREIPNISVTTDIIVGFPGETDEDFGQTLDLVTQARFAGAFTFLYSKREGTKAAGLQNEVPKNIASERFQRLLDTINPIALELNKANEGRVLGVLVEKYENGVYTGRAPQNTPIHFPGDVSLGLVDRIVDVKITDVKTFYMMGEVVL